VLYVSGEAIGREYKGGSGMSKVEIEKVVIKIVRVEIEIGGTFSSEDTNFTANTCLREELRKVLRQVGIPEGQESSFTYDGIISYEKDGIRAVFRGICIGKHYQQREIAE